MAKGQRVKASLTKGKHIIDVNLSLLTWCEKGIYYFYSPALDVTGYGKSLKEARVSFEVTLTEFLTYTHNKKTIYEELERLGWTVNKNKRRVHAPDSAQLMEDNKSLKKLYSRPGVKEIQKEVELAL